jgi:ligand-binding sensor domain-containing protein
MSGPQHEPAIGAYPGWSNLASQLHVNAIAVHSLDGTIWLATPGGVLRWTEDQLAFTRYASEHGLPGNTVAHIAIDTSGQVWAASETGINYLDGDIWQPYVYACEEPIHCMKCANASTLYVAAGNNLYTLTSPHTMPHVTPLPLGTPPRALAATHEQGIWLCNARGLYHWERDHWQPRLLQPNLLTLEITHQFIWVGTTSGLVCIDLTQDKPCRSAEWPSGVVTALAVGTGEANVWAACGGKLGLATPTGWKMLLNRTQTNELITCLALTHHQNLWIGTPKGLFIACPTEIRKCVTDSPPDVIGLSDQKKPTPTFCNLVQALTVQQLATISLLWIGTASHLYCLDLTTEHWKRFSSFHDVRACIPRANTGELLVASWSEGVYSLREKSQMTHAPIMPPVLALCQGADNTYWAASLDGLYKNDGEGWKLVLSSQELGSSNWIQTLAQTTSEQLWLGTTAGLFTYQPTKRLLEAVNGIPPDIRALLVSSHGDSKTLWIGTECGLYRLQPTSLQPVLVDIGITDIGITALSRDEQAQTLWIGTEQGLLRLYDDDNQCTTEQYTTQNSGLAASHITALAHIRDEDGGGRVWIGTTCGLSCFKY